MKKYGEFGINDDFVQDNELYSVKGVYNILDPKLNIVNKLLPWIREVTTYENLNEKDLIFSDKDLKYPHFSKN